ncbi:3D domain-containing protein [Vagococcus carniphilus]|uniref:3D domain-containing protein n=1 Tax=Vagococcus carniphilus TaxID=218144 RepID=A0AAW8U846_9ENTE|nr:3D domain-containing protein [Vagococcus carniphilus]MDT2830098.1 3D domain-containing protein [Vagococcus carniphilus]MDT2833982.1 3D domain-containing protein [Vagococcus carniphilus]MDT2838531.1 3D domain-containing protein [Vagococcus carniphilus]MDT2853368.1 3D domain-containing protein [Vagococcus carniphilus]
MKVKGLSLMLLSSIVAVAATPVVSLAADSKEESVKKESIEISSKIDKALDSVNTKYQEVESLKSEVAETEGTIKETQNKIQETEQSIAKRTELMGDRMKSMQENSSSMNLMDALLTADNMSDFFNRAYAVTVLQGAEKSKVDSLANDKDKLDELKVSLEDSKSSLSEKQTAMETEASSLEKNVASLKEELSDNQAVLEKLSKDRIAKEAQAKKAAVEEANRKELDAKIQEKEAKKPAETKNEAPITSTSKVSQPVKEEVVEEEQPTPAPTETSSGSQVLQMEATGYSYTQPGLSNFTATGIDLRENSRVIAVDPSVIPLGSVVEVSGYGYAVAGDTGGAIIGNRIDLHFNTVAECTQWGRRSVTVTVK